MLGWRNLGPCAVVTAIALTIGCTSDEEPIGNIVLRPTPVAKSSVSGKLVGGSVTGGQSAPKPHLVLIAPDTDTLSLNAPAADGTTPAGYATERVLTAKVLLTDGNTDPPGIVWTSSDPQRVSVIDGVAKVLPGASGDVVVTATSATDPTKSDSLVVHVTTDGELDLSVTPVLAPLEAENSRTTLRITQNGTALPDQSLINAVTARLPAGTYTFQVTRTLPDAPSVTWTATDVAITPNGVTSLQGDLQ